MKGLICHMLGWFHWVLTLSKVVSRWLNPGSILWDRCPFNSNTLPAHCSCDAPPTAANRHCLSKRLSRMHHELWLCPLRLSMPHPEVCAWSAPVCEPIRHNLLPVLLHSKSVFNVMHNSIFCSMCHNSAGVALLSGLPEGPPVIINWKLRVSCLVTWLYEHSGAVPRH